MSRPAKIEAEKVIGTKMGENKVTFTEKDTILYALGIGFSTDPMRQADYKYTNQLNDQFTVFSTYGCMVSKFDPISPLLEHPNMPEFSPFIILHAEQKLVLVKDKIIPGVQYTSYQEIVDVLDKGKNALVVFRTNSFIDNNGKKELAFYNEMTLLLRGYGGFGFKGKGVTTAIPKVPEIKPDHVIKATSFPGQAFIYRLSGDINPLHIDPNISAIQKFQRPIIHGLASYGIVARAISQELLNNDSSRIKSYHARFIGHVFPGESYEILVWKNGNKWVFLVSVIQRKAKALVGQIEIGPEAKL